MLTPIGANSSDGAAFERRPILASLDRLSITLCVQEASARQIG